MAQNVILSSYGYLQKPSKYGRSFQENFDFLLKSQWSNPADLLSIQSERLRLLITHAYNTVPYYRRVFDACGARPEDIRTPDNLGRLPMLTKNDIKTNFDDLISTSSKRYQGHLIGTSGTTGTPLQFLWDRRREAMENALLLRHLSWAGFRRGEPKAVLRGLDINVENGCTDGPFWRYNRATNELLFSSSHLSTLTVDSYIKRLRNFRPTVIWGYPSSVYIFASFLAAKKENLGFELKGVFLSSEPVYSWQTSVIESVFQTKIFDWYGLSEGVISAGQCEFGNYHVNVESGIMELIPSPYSSELREIVATGLDNYMMPLIRYRTGDIVGLADNFCQCGRGLTVMGKVQTKAEDLIITPDNRSISPSILTFPFKSLKGIVKSQILQLKKDSIVIKLVTDDQYAKSAEAKFVHDMKNRLGGNVSVAIEYVHDIPRTSAGKYRWVISNIQPEI